MSQETPIDRMIDSVCKCVKCGKVKRDCRCWVECECAGCGAKWLCERQRPMSPNIARMVMPECLQCDPDAFNVNATCSLFDFDGREI